jgi:hypothetical protein
MKTIPATIIAVCSLLLSGCFSAAVRYGEGWNGDSTPTGHKVAAGAADAATLPLQAPFLIAAGANAGVRSQATKNKNKKLEEIRQNPEIIFIQNLHRSRSDSVKMAVNEALWDSTTPFTDSQLRRLYTEMDWRKVYILSHPNCSLAFLSEAKTSMASIHISERTQLIEHLARNPKIPIDWLREWASDPANFGYGSQYAKSWLERRRNETNK